LAVARAAVLSCGVPGAVASHHTAARVHRMATPDDLEHVTVPRHQRRACRADLVFHGCALDPEDVEVRRGVPITTAPRSLLDLAAIASRLNAVWAVDDALRRTLVTRPELDAALLVGVVGKRVAEADGLAESILETAGRPALSDANLPPPSPQYRVFIAGSLMARLDAAYPEQRLGIEYDGRAAHGSATAIHRDRGRQNLLHQSGWKLLRFTWEDVVHNTPSFVRAVRSCLGGG
jgi:hypothetical protein